MKNRRKTWSSVFTALIICLMFGAPARAQEIAAPATQSMTSAHQPRVAVVLGGGGARGLAHVGVLRVLQQAKVPIDLIVGTSAGSIVGALYADRPEATALQNLLTDAKRKDFIDFSLLHILDGPVEGNALVSFLQTNMRADDFGGLKIRFVAVATDLVKGEVFPIDSGAVAPAVHASAALPPYFHSVSLDGHTLVDGGVTAPLAVNVALKYRPQVVIAVNVSGRLSSKMPRNSIGEVARSYSITLDVLEQITAQKADIVIVPDVGTAGTFDASDKKGLFDAGAAAATKSLPKIKELLAVKGIVSPASP